MSLFQRYRWFAVAGGITLGFAALSMVVHRSAGLTTFADLAGLVLMLVAAAIMLANAMARPDQERSFWALMAVGFSLWACNQAAWAYCEIVQHRQVPDLY